MRFGRRPRLAALCIRPALVLFGVALLLAACGTATGPGAEAGPGTTTVPGSGTAADARVPTPTPPVTHVSSKGHVCLDEALPPPDVPDAQSMNAGTRLPSTGTFRFVQCRLVGEMVPGEGEWLVRTEEQSVGDAGALAAALRRPDDPPSTRTCLAYADGPFDLWAVDPSGRAVLVRIPVDGCGHHQAALGAGLTATTWRETGRRRLKLTTPQAAIDSGCPNAYSDMAGFQPTGGVAGGKPPTAGSFHALETVTGGSACVYRVTDHSQKPGGPFERGARVVGAAWGDLVAAFDRAPQFTGRCSGLPARFAVVGAKPDLDPPAYVELDTCRRVLTPDGGLRQATPELVRLLSAA